MQNRALIFFSAACALFVSVSSGVQAQENSTRFASGVIIAVKAETIPPQSNGESGNFVANSSSGDIMHRVISDPKGKVYFGYDLKAVREPQPNTFRVSIRPLSVKAELLLKTSGFRSQTVKKYPEDVVVEDGDTINFETLENPSTGVKVVDLIKVTTEDRKFGTYFAERMEAKDFTVDDVDLRLDRPVILCNDEKIQTNAGASGHLVWVYIRGKGRFIFSFTPQPDQNFQKIGVIEDNKILFDHDGVSYQVINKTPVLGSGGKWNLWVRIDPAYKPEVEPPTEQPYQLGAADEVQYLFREQG